MEKTLEIPDENKILLKDSLNNTDVDENFRNELEKIKNDIIGNNLMYDTPFG